MPGMWCARPERLLVMVFAAGFEPATPRSHTGCATRLRYAKTVPGYPRPGGCASRYQRQRLMVLGIPPRRRSFLQRSVSRITCSTRPQGARLTENPSVYVLNRRRRRINSGACPAWLLPLIAAPGRACPRGSVGSGALRFLRRRTVHQIAALAGHSPLTLRGWRAFRQAAPPTYCSPSKPVLLSSDHQHSHLNRQECDCKSRAKQVVHTSSPFCFPLLGVRCCGKAGRGVVLR